MPDNSQAIAAIDAILRSGTKRQTITVDGQSTSVEYDFDELRRQRADLAKNDTGSTAVTRRPPIVTAKMPGL